MRLFFMASLLLLGGCAAAPQDACSRQCEPVYGSCMDSAGGLSQTAQEVLNEQCSAAYQACTSACRQDQRPQ